MSEETNDAIWRLNDIKRAYPLDKSDEWAVDMAIAALSAESMRWIPVTEKLPSDCDEDWVLAQIQEDNGYLWIPKVMEYRKDKDDWYGTDENLGWLKNHNGAFKVIAWMPLPKPWSGKESE